MYFVKVFCINTPGIFEGFSAINPFGGLFCLKELLTLK